MIILDVGSENTKMSLVKDGKIVCFEIKNIPFKKNYTELKGIADTDFKILFSYIDELKQKYNTEIYIFATSVFRNMPVFRQESIKNLIKEKYNIDFNIITQEEESYLTTKSALKNVDLKGNIAVLVTGGGSTEITVFNDGKLLKQENTEIGVVNITKQFPTLKENLTDLKVDEVTSYVKTILNIPKYKVKALIICGGAVKTFFELAEYPLVNNSIYENEDHPVMIYAKEELEADNNFYDSELNYFKEKMPENPNWWDGCRAAQAIVNVVTRTLAAEYIIPINVGMIYAIADTITDRKRH